MEGGIGVAFSIGLDETTMAIPSNCLNKTRQTSHPGNGVPYPLCSTEPPPLWAGVPADIALNRRVPAQGTLWHALRGEETHFKGQKERGFSFPPHFSFLCPVSYFYPIQKGLSEEDCCCRLKWCLTQENNLDTQFDVLSIFFRNIVFGKSFTSITSLNPLWKPPFPRPPSPLFAWVGKWKSVISFMLAVTATTKSIAHSHLTLGHSNATTWATQT